MSLTEPPYAYGSIVLVADMLDPRGHYPKDRPCVVVTQPGSTPEGWELVVAISTRLPDPLPDDHVLLPWQRPHHPKTGLNMRNAAIGGWIEVIDEGRIIRKLGFVPDRPLLALTEVLDRLYPPEDKGAGE